MTPARAGDPDSRSRWGARRVEVGAAPVEFALVSALLVLLFLAVVQIGYALHVRNTATAHVIEGARVGARADNTPADGVARAEELLATTLPGRYGTTISGARADVGGVAVVRVSADLPLPVLGPLGIPGTMTVTGQAYAEDQ
ncbi:pilus assembly protein [Ornithinimicrobium ciconiae]|uniref:Pilus assembly protein n=1 Tax=Ornithinimicrobium ciconiae TaxID=2594265 RepID=A0A516GCL1_9MICO|nr:TadE/TadG family type IV pilus assembly protein [Ornithinimicrobium ciconiae]QDO89264.1 pilus assembly protein [Ornithinimicrobium ciconiae]